MLEILLRASNPSDLSSNGYFLEIVKQTKITVSNTDIDLTQMVDLTVGYSNDKFGGAMLGMVFKDHGYLFVPVEPGQDRFVAHGVKESSGIGLPTTEFNSIRLNRQSNSSGTKLFDFYVTGTGVSSSMDQAIWKASHSFSDGSGGAAATVTYENLTPVLHFNVGIAWNIVDVGFIGDKIIPLINDATNNNYVFDTRNGETSESTGNYYIAAF